MRYVFMMLLVMISGCVLNQPQNFVVFNEYHSSKTSTVSSTNTSTTETPAVHPVKVVVSAPAQVVQTKCVAFILPEAVAIPVKPKFADLELNNKTDFDTILVSHIKTLEGHVRAERLAIEDAYSEWLKSCK